MPNQTSSKPLPRAFALLAVALLAMCALGGVMASEESSAAIDTGSASSPLSSISGDFGKMTYLTFYARIGTTVNITTSGAWEIDDAVTDVSPFGLTLNGYSSVTGTITKTGTIEIKGFEDEGGLEYDTVTIVVVKTTPVTSIKISPSLYSGSSMIINSTGSYRATCYPQSASDVTVTWSLSNSCAKITRTWDDTYNNEYRNGVDITGVSKGTVVLTATANDGSGVKATYNLTISNYPYYLNLDYNDGTGETDYVAGEATDNTSTVYITIPSEKPTRDGYTFLGWSKSSTATSASYQPGDRIPVTYDEVTLYAVWKENKQNYYAYLNYNANGGSGAPSSQSDSIYASSASGSKTFTISSTKPTRSGYEFQGWSTSSGSSSASYQPGSTISVSYGSSVTLYAVWKQTYTSTLNFNANGGTGAPSALTYTGTSTSAHTFTIPSTTPSRSGFIFNGWSESGSATTASYQPNSTISVPYNGSKTLYAVWQAADLDITSEPATKSIKVGQSWSYTPTTNVSGCTVTVSGADWLSVSNGKISGTPTASGTYNVTVTVSKTGYNSDSQTFALKVYSSLGFNSIPGAHGLFAYAE